MVPRTTNITKPIDEIYKLRSAITKPTRKNKFVDGRKGTTIKMNAIAKHLNNKKLTIDHYYFLKYIQLAGRNTYSLLVEIHTACW